MGHRVPSVAGSSLSPRCAHTQGHPQTGVVRAQGVLWLKGHSEPRGNLEPTSQAGLWSPVSERRTA